MRKLIIIILLLSSIVACGGAAAIGDVCSVDQDCGGGLVCVPIAHCGSKLCTQLCDSNAACPPDFADPDCDPVDNYPNDVCLYGGWQDQCPNR